MWIARPSLQVQRLDAFALEAGDTFDVGARFQRGDIDLVRKMSAVHHDHAVFEKRQVGRSDDTGRAGDGDDHVGAADRGLAQRRDETVEMRFERRHRIDVDDTDHAEGVAEACSRALAAGAVAEHRHPLAVGAAVGEAHVAFEQALADGMPVLGELLDGTVVDDEDRQLQPFAQRLEPRPARGRLLRPTEQVCVGALGHAGEQVAAIVEQEIGPLRENGVDEIPMRGGIGGLLADHRDALPAAARRRCRPACC